MPLIDDLSSNLRQALKIPIDLNDQSNDLPVAEHTSESLIAIEKLIRSNIERQINNDYSAAKTLLEQAIKEDFSFTHAYTHLTRTNQLMGNSMEAAQALSEGLKHEYKLTTEEKFLYRGIAYGLRGNYLSQIKIYDMWIELYPEDVRAYEIMAHLLLITGIDLDKALTSLQQLRKLNPNDQSVLRSMTQLFVLRDELDKAIKSQQSYTSMNPQDNEALIELANIYERTAQFDLAQEIYQRVLLLDMDNHQASIKLALLDLKLGEFESAENRLAILLASVSDNKNRFDILQGYLAYYSARGQLEKVLSTIEQMKENSQHLPPLLKIFNLEFSSSFYLANLGKFDSAHSVLESVRKQLQPPIDTIVELGAASAYLLADDEGKAGQSIEKLEKYIQDYPNPMFSSAIDSSKAMLMKLQGNLEEAIKLSEKSLNVLKGTVVNTQDETSILGQRVLLANMRNANGETQRAKEELLAILKLYPSLAQAHIALAKCYLAENDIESFALSMEHADESWKDADANYIEYKKFIDLRTEHLPK